MSESGQLRRARTEPPSADCTKEADYPYPVPAEKLDLALRVAIREAELEREMIQKINETEAALERAVIKAERAEAAKKIARMARIRARENEKEWLVRLDKKDALLKKNLAKLDRKLQKNALKFASQALAITAT